MHFASPLVAAAGLALAAAAPAGAAVIITVQEVGGEVVATGSGTLDLDALNFQDSFASISPQIAPSLPALNIGEQGGLDRYALPSPGFPTFDDGNGGFTVGTGTGDLFGTSGGTLNVPAGYVSDTPLAGTATFSGTYASLGVQPGTYAVNWGSVADGNFDSLTVNVVPIPEPATAGLLLGGLGLLVTRRRRQTHIA